MTAQHSRSGIKKNYNNLRLWAYVCLYGCAAHAPPPASRPNRASFKTRVLKDTFSLSPTAIKFPRDYYSFFYTSDPLFIAQKKISKWTENLKTDRTNVWPRARGDFYSYFLFLPRTNQIPRSSGFILFVWNEILLVVQHSRRGRPGALKGTFTKG